MRRWAILPLVGMATACLNRGAPLLVPMRIAPPPESTTTQEATITRPISTVEDDRFHRIDRMEWPGPNSYRDASGTPGPEYWQQRADYTIAATLDTVARSIRATVSIRYTNNSPDTL
ncbi:MAG TPA: hypothetical protein VHV78_09690, partial [Gemmatimonadaceae bacterium]|nr:hypothetical protein [Gemmatimonadaceae bacterium]